MIPALALVWNFPTAMTTVAMSVNNGTWSRTAFGEFWLVHIKGPTRQTHLLITNPEALTCYTNALYVDERSYMGRVIQPIIRETLFAACKIEPQPIKPRTAMLYRRVGSGDMVNPGSTLREFVDAHVWEAELRRQGYKVSTTRVPDEFCEQVQAWASGYEIVTSPHGAQLLMAMAASEGTTVVEFFPDRFKSYLYCTIKYQLGIRWFNVLRVLNQVIVNDECSPRHDRSSLPGCFKGFVDGFCCRGCNWRRDRPITIGNHSALILDYVQSTGAHDEPLSIFEEDVPFISAEGAFYMHATSLVKTRERRRRIANGGGSARDRVQSGGLGALGQATMVVGAEEAVQVTDVFTMGEAMVKGQGVGP